MLTIRKLKMIEIEIIKNFPPEDWHFNIVDFLKLYYFMPYFQIIAAVWDNKIVGVGNVFILGNTAWLGNIIVSEEYRNKGIGKEITKKLISIAGENNCKSILLIATKEGEKLYSKLGFKISSFYEFYRNENVLTNIPSKKITENTPGYYSQVEKLDKIISGDDRFFFLKPNLKNSFIYHNSSNDKVEGFYLSDFGNGLIIAENDKAGIELLKLRCMKNRFNTVIPEQNESAKKFLINNGFELYNKAPRMYFGKEVNWKPELVFSRGSGYLG